MTSLTEAADLRTTGEPLTDPTASVGWRPAGAEEFTSQPAVCATAERPSEARDTVVLPLSGLRLDVQRNRPFRPLLRVTMPGRPAPRAWPVAPTLIADWRLGRLASGQRGEPRWWTAAWGTAPTGWRAPRVEFRVRRRRRAEVVSVAPMLLSGAIWVAEIGDRAEEVAVCCAGLLESRDLRR